MRRKSSGGQKWGPPMYVSPRLMIGFGAGFASMAFVLLAGFTSPDAEVTHHASTCPASQQALPPADVGTEAERPA